MYITRDDVMLGFAKSELVQLTNDDPYGSEPIWRCLTAPSNTPASWPTAI